MRKRCEDRIGEKFCRLTIIECLQDKKQYRYLCDCGKVGITNCRNILSASTKSCGCLNDEKRSTKEIIKRSLIRGYTKSCNECNNVGMQGKTFGKYMIIGEKQ